MEAIGLIAAQVRTCESIGVQFLCCPEGVLGGLADYASRPYEIAIDAQNGQLQRALTPISSETVTTILGFTEVGDDGRLFNSAAVFTKALSSACIASFTLPSTDRSTHLDTTRPFSRLAT